MMNSEFPRLIDRMERFPHVLGELLRDVSIDENSWRPPDDGWSIREIVGHLLDEEELDFRTRLKLTLEDPELAWPPIDPPATVLARGHQNSALGELLSAFAAERAASVAWLRTLESPDWSRAKTHPVAGALSAGDLMVSWANHDILHLRQIAKRLHQVQEARSGFSSRYAGDLM